MLLAQVGRRFESEFVIEATPARCGCAIGLHMTTCPPITRRIAPQQQPGPLRLRFSAMKPGEWERIRPDDELHEKRIRITAERAGCECGWEQGTNNLIVKKKGRAK